MENKIENKIQRSLKWSSITEMIAKLIQPITNMLLARILAPDIFGVVATVNMIISFTDMFTDAGFQNYLVQHEFKNHREKELSINIAFWTNLLISIIIWIVIIIFSDKLAIMVGNPGLGKVISIACIQLPLTSFSSIQMAIYRRSFNYKTLFFVRVVGICIPFILTIPLALMGFGYWALIVGNIFGTLSNAIILTLKSDWKPKFEYKIKELKAMLSFSIWSLMESIAIWLSSWVDTFIIGSVLNSYYLGIYKTSMATVSSIFSIITGATTPVLFSSLSRLQNDEKQFNTVFFTMQRNISYLVIPISTGIFIFSEVVVKILLGNQWMEASYVISRWGLTQGITIVLSHYSSVVYRSKGKPKLSLIAQIVFLTVLIPVCYIYSRYDFITFINIRSLTRIVYILIHSILMTIVIGIPIKEIFKNIRISMIASIIMGVIGYNLNMISNNLICQIISIFICIIAYFSILLCFKDSRKDIINIIIKSGIIKKVFKKKLNKLSIRN